MATDKILIKNFSKFQGLDLKSSDLVRQDSFSSGLLNADINDSGALEKRLGYQYKAEAKGGIGMAVYKDINTTTGALTNTVVCLDSGLNTLVSDSFNVTYSGSGTALLTIKVDPDTDKFMLTIVEDAVTLLEQDLGLGIDESSATSIATVITAIDALTDFAASGGTITTGSAAFLDLHRSTQLTSTATAIKYKRWAAANVSKATPLSTTWAARNDDDFENCSTANINNILYVSSGYDKLHKYDGQTFYRAGLPAGGDADGSGDAGTAPTLADTGSGTTFSAGNDYFYFYQYVHIDNKGNEIIGTQSPFSSKYTVAAANTDANVTVTNLSASSGFNTNCAIVNGAQNGVTTITVDSGHTLNAGDTAYFYDGSSSDYVTKTLTSTTATSITFSGAVNVADNAVISNNLRIRIYRTDEIGAATDASIQVYSLVADIPNDSIGASTQVYVDAISDANLGAEFVAPIKLAGLPPKGRYLTAFRNQLFIAGDPANVNTCYYSDIDSPEAFPAGDNSFLVDAFAGSKIRGLSSLNTAVLVFKDESIQTVTGDISDDKIRVDEISYGGIGCLAHHSIQQIQGAVLFLSTNGIYAVSLEGVSPIGSRIESEFTKTNDFTFQRATSVNWVNEGKYVLFIPEVSSDGSSVDYANSDSVVYVYDYMADAFLKWDAINAMGGFAYVDTDLYFLARRYDSIATATEYTTARFGNYGNLLDYNDHQNSITFEYNTHWEALGDPQVFKKFLRLKVFALQSDIREGESPLFTLSIDQEINYLTPAAIATFTMDFSGGALGYGNGAYGDAPYGDSTRIEIKGKLRSSKTRAMRLKFYNDTQDENILISGYELEVAAPYKPNFKE